MKGLTYRIFPIYFIAFFRVARATIADLALAIYYAEISLSPDIIGWVLAARAFSYLFSPLLLRGVSKKIGMKNCMYIAAISNVFVAFSYELTLDPTISFIVRFIDGFTLGIFWPVLMGSVSEVCKLDDMRESTEKKDRLMKRYSLSWNLGGIVSYLVGTIILFFVEDIFMIFHIAVVFAFIHLAFVFFYRDPTSGNSKELTDQQIEAFKIDLERENVTFPKFIPFFIAFIYAFYLGTIGLNFPLKSEVLQFALFTNYLFFFIRMSMQTVMLSWSMDYSINFLKKMFPYILLGSFVIFIMFGLNDNLIVYGILFAINGVLLSFYYLFAFKLVIFRNMVENTHKYSNYFESVIGLGFFVSPIIAGYIAAIDINLSFFVISAMALGSLFIFLALRKKIISR